MAAASSAQHTTDPFAAPDNSPALVATVEQRLLALGGDRTLIDPLDEDLPKLAERGRTWPTTVNYRPGAPSQCHANTADGYLDGAGRIATGYLSAARVLPPSGGR